MTLRNKTRALAGLAAVLTLLGLIVADTVYPAISLSIEDKLLLVSLVSALLGIDIALKQLPIEFSGGGGNDE
jgi:hypothetical protein